MARKRVVPPSAAEVAFNLFAKLTDSERCEFSRSVYGKALWNAIRDSNEEHDKVADDGQ